MHEVGRLPGDDSRKGVRGLGVEILLLWANHTSKISGLRAWRALGALPVVAGFCRRLGISDIIDRLCPIRDVAIATHGQVIEALVANRLTSPPRCCGWRTGPGTERFPG